MGQLAFHTKLADSWCRGGGRATGSTEEVKNAGGAGVIKMAQESDSYPSPLGKVA